MTSQTGDTVHPLIKPTETVPEGTRLSSVRRWSSARGMSTAAPAYTFPPRSTTTTFVPRAPLRMPNPSISLLFL